MKEQIQEITKKQSIINVAATVFSEHGYKQTTVREIARRVGIEASSLYSHVRSKEDMLAEICTSCAEKFTEGMQAINQSDLSPKKKIKALIALHIDIAYTDAASAIVFNDEWRNLPPDIMKSFLKSRKEYESNFKSILSQGKKDKKLNFDALDITFQLIINLLSWTYIGTKSFKKEQLDVHLNTFIANALKFN